MLWQIGLDSEGAVREVHVRRARVRSRAQLDYAVLQQALTDGTAPEAATLFPEIGALRLAQARARNAINLEIPDQEVVKAGESWTLAIRHELPVERWNAELSLLTGMCAAQLMLEHDVGILRTLPAPDVRAVHALRRAARALGVAWPDGAQPGDVLATLDRGNPHHVALLEHATSLLRGAGYTSFDRAAPAHCDHSGIGAPYAHVTAPLRRLVDRYGSEVCLAL